MDLRVKQLKTDIGKSLDELFTDLSLRLEDDEQSCDDISNAEASQNNIEGIFTRLKLLGVLDHDRSLRDTRDPGISQAEYLANSCRCPVCECTDLDAGTLNHAVGEHVYQDITCNKCKATWVDDYQLAGYDDLEVLEEVCDNYDADDDPLEHKDYC